MKLINGRNQNVRANLESIRKEIFGDTSIVSLECYESVNISFDEPNEEIIVSDGTPNDEIYPSSCWDSAILYFLQIARKEYTKLHS